MIEFILEAKSNFEKDGMQNYFMFQPILGYFKSFAVVGGGNYICFWRYRGLSDENVNPQLRFYGTKTRVEFKRSCLRKERVTYGHGKVVNIYIVYEIKKIYEINNYLTLENEKYFFTLSGGTGRNLIILIIRTRMF